MPVDAYALLPHVPDEQALLGLVDDGTLRAAAVFAAGDHAGWAAFHAHDLAQLHDQRQRVAALVGGDVRASLLLPHPVVPKTPTRWIPGEGDAVALAALYADPADRLALLHSAVGTGVEAAALTAGAGSPVLLELGGQQDSVAERLAQATAHPAVRGLAVNWVHPALHRGFGSEGATATSS